MSTRSGFSKGQMLVLFTLLLPVLLGVMALGADFSIIYLNWAMVQKAADAAALAGASQLTGVTGSAATVKSAVVNYVNGYACFNGIKNSGTSTLCTAGASRAGYADSIVFTNVTDTQVSVGIHRSVPYFFGKMIGLNEAAVAATATAAITPIGTVAKGLFPVGLQCDAPCSLANLKPGSSKGVTFGQKFVGSIGASGNWQWIDVGQGNGAKQLGDILQNGASSSFSIGQTIGSSPGNKANSNPVQTGLANRLAACKPITSATDPCQNGGQIGKVDGIGGSDSSAVPANNPCLVIVPAVDFTGCNGSCSLSIEGFAQIYLEQDSTTSAIDACFVQGSTSSAIGNAGAPNLGPLTPPILIN